MNAYLFGLMAALLTVTATFLGTWATTDDLKPCIIAAGLAGCSVLASRMGIEPAIQRQLDKKDPPTS